MRVLVVIPHFFGTAPAEQRKYNNLPEYSSTIEPIGRIAGFNETIVALLGNFGPNRYKFTGEPIFPHGSESQHQVDIVVVTMRDHNILPLLGLAPGTFQVTYVDCKPSWIPFQVQSVLRERLGSYDFYCYVEDDIIINDPAFFEKLLWFQRNFGPKTLLAPVRYELASTGTPAKVIIDMELREDLVAPLRRPNQKRELQGVWNGRSQTFHLPSNPHAASFFLTDEQMKFWVAQPSFDDRDESWFGPIESAATLSIGKVFDIYKPVRPDPFFFEVHHYGVRFSVQSAPPQTRRGEPPLLAIAQNAVRAAIESGRQGNNAAAAEGDADISFAGLVEKWIAQGTAVEHRAYIDALRIRIDGLTHHINLLTAELDRHRARPGVYSAGGGPAQVPAHNPQGSHSSGKMGRNQPCHCGSGKKFKHCHGRAA